MKFKHSRQDKIYKKNKNGFTLIEVLLGLALAGVSIVLLLQSYLLVSRSAARHRQAAVTIMLLEQKLFDLKYQEGTFEREGRFPMPYENYGWKIDAGNRSLLGIQDIILKVFSVNKDKKPQAILATAVRRGGNAKR